MYPRQCGDANDTKVTPYDDDDDDDRSRHSVGIAMCQVPPLMQAHPKQVPSQASLCSCPGSCPEFPKGIYLYSGRYFL